MNLLNVCNSIDINSYFSFSLWFQISSISSFRLHSVAPENIDVRILSLNSFVLKTLKEVQLKCETGPLYPDVDKYGHAGILFLTKMYQFIV